MLPYSMPYEVPRRKHSKNVISSEKTTNTAPQTAKPSITNSVDKNEKMKLTSPRTMVTILVGKGANPTKFMMHKGFACHYSPVFKAAFNSNFIEGQTQTYHLKDDREKVVDLFVEWVYTKTISSSDNDAGYNDLIELWTLADKLYIPELQNKVTDQLHQMSYKPTGRCATDYMAKIYDCTSLGSPFRKFAVAEFARINDPGVLTDKSYDLNQNFLADYAGYLHGKLKLFKSASWNIRPSNYYVAEKKPPKATRTNTSEGTTVKRGKK